MSLISIKTKGFNNVCKNDIYTYTENIIERNSVGVAVMFSRRITMKHNTFGHNWGHPAYGLLLKEIYDAEIIDNHFTENTVGIFVEGSNRVNYLRNEFKRNGWGGDFNKDDLKNGFIDEPHFEPTCLVLLKMKSLKLRLPVYLY